MAGYNMTTSEKIIELVNDEQSFHVKLRCMEGLDEEQVARFLDLLDELAVELKGQTHLDKRVVECMFGVMSTFNIQRDYYDGETKRLIIDYESQIQLKIMECVGQD